MSRISNSRRALWLLALLAVMFGVVWWRWHDANETQSSRAYRARPREKLTFSREIAPLIFQHCSECHRPGAPGPFSLLTFADVAKRARQIAEVTRRRVMPPWLPEPGHVKFLEERGLSAEELGLLQQWIAEGAVEGNPAHLPAPPAWPAGWRLGAPDLVLQMPEAYRLGADGPDIYRNFVVPAGLTNGHWVRAVEFQPGGRGGHHARVMLDETGQCRQLDDAEPGPGFGGWMRRAADGSVRSPAQIDAGTPRAGTRPRSRTDGEVRGGSQEKMVGAVRFEPSSGVSCRCGKSAY